MNLKLLKKEKNHLEDLIYLIKKIKKATIHINDEMNEYAEEFYKNKKDKDNDLER